jgi:hypothetical protein
MSPECMATLECALITGLILIVTLTGSRVFEP